MENKPASLLVVPLGKVLSGSGVGTTFNPFVPKVEILSALILKLICGII